MVLLSLRVSAPDATNVLKCLDDSTRALHKLLQEVDADVGPVSRLAQTLHALETCVDEESAALARAYRNVRLLKGLQNQEMSLQIQKLQEEREIASLDAEIVSV